MYTKIRFDKKNKAKQGKEAKVRKVTYFAFITSFN